MAARYADDSDVTGWVGWIYFAGLMMLIVGVFQIILGLTALLNDGFYFAQQGRLLVFNYQDWGWAHLIYGIVVLMAGVNLFSGRAWARVVAVVLAGFNFLLQFAFVSAYPIWSIILMVVDLLVIYALTVHGREARIDAG